MMMMGAIGIAAQHPPAGPQACRFYLLDGSPVDSALSGQLGRLKDVLPHPVTNVTWRDLAATYGELAAEIKRRQESTSDDQAPIYIFIYDVQRFRDLRKSDDDFGYSRYDEDKPAPPSKLFGDVLRDGPPVGIHTIIWCDSVNNMNRTFDRQGMKEFENRILFQMSANDSSTLIDTPAASKLGENRALYYSEEENRIEKFRPYGIPELEWLEGVKGGSPPVRVPRSTVRRTATAMVRPHRTSMVSRRRTNGAAQPAESHATAAPPSTSPWNPRSRPFEPEPLEPAPGRRTRAESPIGRRSRSSWRLNASGVMSTPRTLISSVPISCRLISRFKCLGRAATYPAREKPATNGDEIIGRRSDSRRHPPAARARAQGQIHRPGRRDSAGSGS